MQVSLVFFNAALVQRDLGNNVIAIDANPLIIGRPG